MAVPGSDPDMGEEEDDWSDAITIAADSLPPRPKPRIPPPISAEITPELLTAFHEAGHAVISVHYHLPVISVSIEPNDDTLGHTRSHNPLRRLCPYRSDPMRWERGIRRQFHIQVAGAEATRLIAPEQSEEGTDGDYAMAAECLLALCDNTAECDAWSNLLGIQARRLVARYRSAIQAVAMHLMEQRTLSGRSVRQLVRDYPPLRFLEDTDEGATA